MLYTKPDDVEGFEAHYRDVHVPLAQKLPNVTGFSASRMVGTPRGTEAAFHLKAELSFADHDTMMAALSGDEGMAVSKDAMEMTQQFGCSAEIMLAEDI